MCDINTRYEAVMLVDIILVCCIAGNSMGIYFDKISSRFYYKYCISKIFGRHYIWQTKINVAILANFNLTVRK